MPTHINVLKKEGEHLKRAIEGLRALEAHNKRLARQNKTMLCLLRQVVEVGEVELSDRKLLAKLHRAIASCTPKDT